MTWLFSRLVVSALKRDTRIGKLWRDGKRRPVCGRLVGDPAVAMMTAIPVEVPMRKLLKFLHTLGGIGLAGALLVQILMLQNMPDTSELVSYATARAQMGLVAQWVLFPSLALVLVSGLLSMAWTDAFHGAGWAWMKLALGVSVFEGTLIAVQGPARREAERAAQALAGEFDPALLGATAAAEWKSSLVILAVAIANVVLAVWRPRFSRSGRA
jgi:hypothetical protein